MATTHIIPLYGDMEARITLHYGTVQGTYASGILFDADVSILASTDSVLYLDCEHGIVSDALRALMAASGIPPRDWEDALHYSVDALGLECHCDCEPGECAQCDAE